MEDYELNRLFGNAVKGDGLFAGFVQFGRVAVRANGKTDTTLDIGKAGATVGVVGVAR